MISSACEELLGFPARLADIALTWCPFLHDLYVQPSWKASGDPSKA